MGIFVYSREYDSRTAKKGRFVEVLEIQDDIHVEDYLARIINQEIQNLRRKYSEQDYEVDMFHSDRYPFEAPHLINQNNSIRYRRKKASEIRLKQKTL